MSNSIISVVKVPLRPLRHGAVAIARQVMLERLFFRREIPPNLVISTGGAGTTFLMKHLAQFVHINDYFDRDHLKHLPRLPAGWLNDRRVLYLFDEPEAVFRSVRRRQFLHKHAGELGSVACQFTWGGLQQKLFERVVKQQVDSFHSHNSENLMLLSFDDIWARAEDIAEFFAIEDDRFLNEFPPRRPRKSEQLQV
ncbi:hypothetical protein [Shimia sp. W99]